MTCSATPFTLHSHTPSTTHFDVIIIDEISMIPAKIFRHILDTLQQLATRPVVLVCGDQYQQQPIHTVAGKITNTDNIYSDRRFSSITTTHNLLVQHTDQTFTDILAHIRHWRPTRAILNTLHSNGRLLHNTSTITDQNIVTTIEQFPLATFVTVSKRASLRVNEVVLKNFFQSDHSLGAVLMDGDPCARDIFKGMRAIITQNRDKKKGVVNGQPAVVKMRVNNTVVLTLPHGKTVCVHPVTSPVTTRDEGGAETDTSRITCYPFVPGYALTICKAQGQTLDKCVLWMDSDILGPGSAYVALSRVRTINDIHFMTPLHQHHFKPVFYSNN